MKLGFLKRWKFWRRLTIWLILFPILLFTTVVIIVYVKQDVIVQELITKLNEDFVGEIEIEDSHVSPFENFPYISIDLDHVKLYEDKEDHSEPIVDLEDIYVGFDLWTLLSGDYDIKVMELKNGYIHVIQHEDGELNITHAFSTQKEVEDVEEEFHMHLKSIELIDVDIYKYNEANELMVESFVSHADLGFKTNDEHILAHVDAQMELNVIMEGDTTFFKHKHLNVDAEMEFFKETDLLVIEPSMLELEHATFTGEGSIDFADESNLDLKLYGEKENFELFMALAPEEIYPVLDRYDNAGEIKFEVDVKGRSTYGNTPLIDATFSCHNGLFENTVSHKKVDQLNFEGHFTNNGKPGLENMEFTMADFTMRPEAGTFSANIDVEDFESPNIDMSLDSDFDLEFLSSFINVTSLEDLRGKIQLQMKFHDIIDLSHPERSIEKLNEAYYSELLVENLGFSTDAYHLPLDNFSTRITVTGHEAQIEYMDIKMGNTDLGLSGHINDLPAIIHHTNDQIIADLELHSKLIDVEELTWSEDPEKQPIDEKIDDLKMSFKFVSSAKKITESPNLPVGEFFVENLYAKLEHYPHTFHDFHADVFVEDSNFRIIDFSGMIDESDFHFNGKLLDYERWLQEHPVGDTKIEFDLTSKHLELDDLFSYKGENYVPEDYRHEEITGLKLHGDVALHFNDGLKSTDCNLTEVDGKMLVHPMRFEDFNGRVHIEDEHIVIEQFAGKIGRSAFELDMNYYYGEDETVRKRDNHFGLRANKLDFDELFNYNEPPGALAESPEEHENVFNIYELPFSTMTIDIDINDMNYHRYHLTDLHGRFRTTPEHYIYVDTLRMRAAGGKMRMSGYFNGSDKDKIYFSPNLELVDVNLDKLLFKFENFGQDYLVSDNLHGKITTSIDGKIHVHADMVPILDDSEVHMDVLVVDGRLVDFAPIVDMKDYFVDKNVHNVKFDTLRNHIDFTNGTINIPNMSINSTLGYIEVSGTQDMDYNMEWYMRVPLNLVAGTGFKMLFGKNKEEVDPEQEDEIEYRDPGKKQAMVNVKIVGDAEDYEVSLGKDKRDKKKRKNKKN
ncbi:MAG: AsmA-like C-terminal region-containing protein [Crocinitomicaceae bacterium]|nr:AsmA-like C-terminal region-containing protein [Crocinitomicaceae bacterium]